jgi:hypothetical protein
MFNSYNLTTTFMMIKSMLKLLELQSGISKNMSISYKKMILMLLKRHNKKQNRRNKARKRRKRKKLSRLFRSNLLLKLLEIKLITLANNTVKRLKIILYKKPLTTPNVYQLSSSLTKKILLKISSLVEHLLRL